MRPTTSVMPPMISAPTIPAWMGYRGTRCGRAGRSPAGAPVRRMRQRAPVSCFMRIAPIAGAIDLAPVDHVEGSIGSEDAVRRPLETLM